MSRKTVVPLLVLALLAVLATSASATTPNNYFASAADAVAGSDHTVDVKINFLGHNVKRLRVDLLSKSKFLHLTTGTSKPQTPKGNPYWLRYNLSMFHYHKLTLVIRLDPKIPLKSQQCIVLGETGYTPETKTDALYLEKKQPWPICFTGSYWKSLLK